jgi:hypothetical protein
MMNRKTRIIPGLNPADEFFFTGRMDVLLPGTEDCHHIGRELFHSLLPYRAGLYEFLFSRGVIYGGT